jgi:membrane protease YdiL (CAAX protease family)
MTIPLGVGQGIAALLAVLAAGFAERWIARRGLRPPGFGADVPSGLGRRFLGLALLAMVFYVVGFGPLLGYFGPPEAPRDLTTMPRIQLFALQALLVVAVVLWHALGHWGLGRGPDATELQPAPVRGDTFARQYGWSTPNPLQELALGVGLGLATWAMVVVALVVIVLALTAIFGDDVMPKNPPAAIPFLVSLPFAWKLGLALSAGFCEELFFRGFLQPRLGILVSTALFATAHLGYGQPFMLVGITLLSLLYAGIVRWRQSVWAAAAAHATFDAVQILIVIPSLLQFMEPESAPQLPSPASPAAPAAIFALLGNWIRACGVFG